MSNKGLINFPGDPLDVPIYRIYPFDIFLAMVSQKKDRLSSPNTWLDPFDNFLLRQTYVTTSNGDFLDPASLANGWYVQCWSLQENSAAMWHLYGTYSSLVGEGGLATINPQNYIKCGIQVKSSPRKLLRHLSSELSNSADNLFCGHVRYMEEYEIESVINDCKFKDFLESDGGSRFAEFMCFKRMAFEHEREIRFIYQDITIDSNKSFSKFHEFSFDPNTLFDEVVLDPRLDDSECKKVTERLQANGVALSIRQSNLYQKRHFQLPFE